MTTTAVLFLVLSTVLIWGGLVASILRLRHDGRRPDPGAGRAEAPPTPAPDDGPTRSA